MKKPVYKLLDEKGRILIPKEFRQISWRWGVRTRRQWKPM